jgi:hypothetical protein
VKPEIFDDVSSPIMPCNKISAVQDDDQSFGYNWILHKSSDAKLSPASNYLEETVPPVSNYELETNNKTIILSTSNYIPDDKGANINDKNIIKNNISDNNIIQNIVKNKLEIQKIFNGCKAKDLKTVAILKGTKMIRQRSSILLYILVIMVIIKLHITCFRY